MNVKRCNAFHDLMATSCLVVELFGIFCFFLVVFHIRCDSNDIFMDDIKNFLFISTKKKTVKIRVNVFTLAFVATCHWPPILSRQHDKRSIGHKITVFQSYLLIHFVFFTSLIMFLARMRDMKPPEKLALVPTFFIACEYHISYFGEKKKLHTFRIYGIKFIIFYAKCH